METNPSPDKKPVEDPEQAEGGKKRGWLSRIGFFWWVVAILIVGDVVILSASYLQTEKIDPSTELRQGVEDSLLVFDTLSFWQRLMAKQRPEVSEIPQKTSAFDGLPIDEEYEESVVSVMIDNFASIRSQHSGIRPASLVYETLVEGGITRLMLIFPYQELERVGPTRSARDYFVEFAEEYGGIYMHAGGAPTALEKLWASSSILDLDEDDRETGETYSYRDENYDAPHNLFVDLLLARERAEELGWDFEAVESAWCFEKGSEGSEDKGEGLDEGENPSPLTSPKTTASVNQIELNFSNDITSSYYVQFRYDEMQNNYKRFYGKFKAIPHTDQYDSLQVAPTNLIVQIAPSYLIAGDDKERLEMQNIGSGKAFYYLNGKKHVGQWEKGSLSEATRYLDEQGNPICLNPGQTWVAVVSAEGLVEEK